MASLLYAPVIAIWSLVSTARESASGVRLALLLALLGAAVITNTPMTIATDAAATAPTNTPTPAFNVDAERAALVAFYNATGGDNWENNDNWLSDAPLGEWYGVTTDEIGRVTILDLSGNDILPYPIPDPVTGPTGELKGEIPPELGNLTGLESLILLGGELSGKIPSTLGRLSHLKWLLLSDNQLSGEIPPELGQLSKLQVLALSKNQLSGQIPPRIWSTLQPTGAGVVR